MIAAIVTVVIATLAMAQPQQWAGLLEENGALKQALYKTKELLDERVNDLRIERETLGEVKRRLEDRDREVQDLQNKYWRTVEEKEAAERAAKEDFKRLQEMVNRKAREMNEMQSKYLGFVDFDLEQKKIENRLELKYAKEIEEKQRAIDELHRTLNDLLRENELNKAKLQSARHDHEAAMNLVKEGNKKQVDMLMAEIAEFQEQRVVNDYKDKYNEARLHKAEAEKKIELLEHEFSTTKTELHNLKLKQNQIIVDHAKEIEKLRNEAWNFKNEKEKLG